MRSGHFEAIWSSLAPLLAKLAYCPEGFLGFCDFAGPFVKELWFSFFLNSVYQKVKIVLLFALLII